MKLIRQELEHGVTLVYRIWKTEVNDYFEFSLIEIPFGDNIDGNQFICWYQQNYEVAVDLTKNADMRILDLLKGIHTELDHL